MTTNEAIAYISAHTWSQWRLGLSRTRELLARMGDPQKKLRFIHVAGSNGKGSTCAMLERILREAGYVTGLFPSPYIEDFRERIQVCGDYITEEALGRITAEVRALADGMEDHPTQFELITAIGMAYFLEKKCDIVVLEVGLGGIYDATNIIEAPEVAVIANIGLEHTEYLGNTLAEIAGNKCGIIKPGSDVVCYQNVPEVMDVVEATCAQKGCPLHIARFDRIVPMAQSLDGQFFCWKKEESAAPGMSPPHAYRLALLGEYQLHNACTALTVVEVLRSRPCGWDISEGAVRRGLAGVQWPARFEVLSKKPLFILDGGHNPQCAEALAASLRQYLPSAPCGRDAPAGPFGCGGEGAMAVADKAGEGMVAGAGAEKRNGQGILSSEKVVFLMGMLADKDYDAVIESLAPFAAGFACLTPDSPRALPAAQLARILRGKGFEAQVCGTAEEGILSAFAMARRLGGQKGPALPIVAFGSLYMAGAVRRAFFIPDDCMGDVRDRKKAQRRLAMARRRALSDEERAQKSAIICRQIAGLAEIRGARTIFSYAAAWDEANLDALNEALEAQGRTVCYPISGQDGAMVAAVPGQAESIPPCGAGPEDAEDKKTSGADAAGAVAENSAGTGRVQAAIRNTGPAAGAWRRAAFGIREPVAELAAIVPPGRIDAVLVPCVAFDRAGGRCGHGGGYYDRFLAQLPADAVRILVAFDAQEVPAVAGEATDISMDLAVTESGIWDFRGMSGTAAQGDSCPRPSGGRGQCGQ